MLPLARAEAVVVESAAWPNCASPACRLWLTCRPLEVSLIFTLSPCWAQYPFSEATKAGVENRLLTTMKVTSFISCALAGAAWMKRPRPKVQASARLSGEVESPRMVSLLPGQLLERQFAPVADCANIQDGGPTAYGLHALARPMSSGPRTTRL